MTIDVDLRVRAPFAGDALLAFLGARAVAGVEDVAGGTYRRSVALAGGPAVLEVELAGARERVPARLRLAAADDAADAVARVRRLCALDADPAAVASALGDDALLGPLVRVRPGLRVPGHVDPDELAIRAVLGQQVSLAGAATLAARLVRDAGTPLPGPTGGVTHLFPDAAAIARLDPGRLAMPRARRAAVLGLAAALARGDVVLDPAQDRDAVRPALLALPGIGPWTAGYVALRALGDPDAFLPSDLGVRHALERLGADGDRKAAARLGARWRPYGASAVVHLWAHLTDPVPAAFST